MLKYSKILIFVPLESQKERGCVCVYVCVEEIMAENFQNWSKKHKPVEFAGS